MPALSNPQIAYRLQGSSDSDWTLLTVADGSFPESFTVTGGAYEVKTLTWSESAQFSVTYSPSFLFAANEPGVWYDPSDMSTMFQDAAGTTPVTAVEQPVGLILDKSKGLTLGPERVTNGTFDTNTVGWTASAGATLTSDAGRGKLVTTAAFQNAAQSIATVASKSYQVQFSGESVGLTHYVAFAGIFLRSSAADGPFSYSGIITVAGASSDFVFGAGNDADGGTLYIDNISVRELPGNHATQPTATARPVLSARYNLLTKTEQFNDAAWAKTNVAVTANAATAPDGTLTADALFETAATGQHRVIGSSITITLGVTYKISVRVKPINGRNWVVISGDGQSGLTLGGLQYFDLSTATPGTLASGVTSATVTAQADGWYLCEIVATAGQTTATSLLYIAAATGQGVNNYAGDITKGIYIWGASLVPANQASLPYQRVNTATDYDADPAKFKPYLRFDGVDDFLVTKTITPNTDKVQVFAGVRKLSDASQIIAETGTSSTSQGAFFVLVEPTNTRYGYAGRGAKSGASTDQTNINGFAAPDTAVLTAKQDINGGTPSQIRRNAGVFQNSTETAFGGGNYLAYPLYIGRRGGTSLPFNGHLYSLITRFGSNLSNDQITQTENWVNEKTGAY